MNTHWTTRSTKDFIFRIAADFIVQLENKMESPPLTQDALSIKLGVTKGRVSQVFNNPGNITLETIVEYCRALNMKVAIVAYEDNDPENKKGPINSEIFKVCWVKSGKPREFWDFQQVNTGIKQMLNPAISDRDLYTERVSDYGIPSDDKAVIKGGFLRKPQFVPSSSSVTIQG